ncbi:MAG: LPS assembly lipoprotein LptE [Desulfobulbales bacterium]
MHNPLSRHRTRQNGLCTVSVWGFLLLLTLGSSGCGYHNPYVSSSDNQQPPAAKTLLITTWQNRTNELGLESIYFRLFNAWFKNSSQIAVVFDEDQADLKLSGEISAINLPGLFYNTFDEALEVKLSLTVRFTLRDTHNNSVLWQERNFTIYEPFLINPSGEKTRYNTKEKALLRIGDQIAELIYLRTHEIVNNMP